VKYASDRRTLGGVSRSALLATLVGLGAAGSCGDPGAVTRRAQERTPQSLADLGASVIEDAPPPFEPPPLTAALHVPLAYSETGRGALELTADPDEHEIRVGLLVGVPVAETRWERCKRVRLVIDGTAEMLKARYWGSPMGDEGVYDAVGVELTIVQVRAMIGARVVRAELCGDALELPASERAELRDFVDEFDHLASPGRPSPPPPPPTAEPDVDPDYSFVPLEDAPA
jgi:hypothetical protein